MTWNFSCEKKIGGEDAENQVEQSTNQAVKSDEQKESQTPGKPPENITRAMKAVEPFFKLMGEPSADDWLATFKESGQTFQEYINNNPTLPSPQRRTIYVQPIGKFNLKQLKIIQLTSEYMRKFFGLPVKLLPKKRFQENLSLKNYRINQFSKNKQIRAGYILEEMLQPNLPKDATALIAFTDEDLFPDKEFNYVFGQASLKNRVGVWSLFRLDDYADFDEFLRQTLKIAVHETGHMFSFAHCTKYECVMSGVNHLGKCINIRLTPVRNVWRKFLGCRALNRKTATII